MPFIGALGLATIGAGAAEAGLTAPEPEAVYRTGPVPIAENVGGRHLKADGVTPMSSTEALSCTFRSTANPNARTAKGVAEVFRVADGTSVFRAESPNTAGALAGLLNNQSGPWSTSWAIPENAPAGRYEVRSSNEDRRRVSVLNPCQLERPAPDSRFIEYRPWQHVFKDVFGGGRVNMNVTPAEVQAVVGTQTGAVMAGGMSFYRLPADSSLALPSDPAACAATPDSCLPSSAVECKPVSATCVPRLVIVNKEAPNNEVKGFFDLETKAFIALTGANGHKRVQLSLGTEQDAAYQGLLQQLAAAGAENGFDLLSILATKVRARANGSEVSLSLLNGLQIQPTTGADGVQLVSETTAQAGLVLDIFANLDLANACVANVGDSDPSTPAPDRYAHRASVGYTVNKSDLLPSVPKVGAAGALVSGPLYHIKGDFVGTGTPVLNTASAVIGLDTAADEPNGYPVWVQPFVSGMNVAKPRTMDFIGTATWSASETPLAPGVGCLTVDFLLGAGVAVYNSPLPIGFGDIPIWDPQSPEVQALVQQINGAVQGAADTVTSNPAVSDLLEQITGALPAVPGVPTL